MVAAFWQKLVDKNSDRMNPSAPMDETSSSIAVGELIANMERQDEELVRLKAEEGERQEKARIKEEARVAKTGAELLTRTLLKHATAIRDGNPANYRPRNVPAKAKNACAASLQVRSLSPSLSPNANR